MPGLSAYLEQKLLDVLLGKITYSAPATLYLGLYSSAPSKAGGGTELTSGTAPGYARLAVTNNTTNFPGASAYSSSTTRTSNGTILTFAEATATWPAVTSMGIFDAASAGYLLAWGYVTSFTLTAGQQYRVPVGGLDIDLWI